MAKQKWPTIAISEVYFSNCKHMTALCSPSFRVLLCWKLATMLIHFSNIRPYSSSCVTLVLYCSYPTFQQSEGSVKNVTGNVSSAIPTYGRIPWSEFVTNATTGLTRADVSSVVDRAYRMLITVRSALCRKKMWVGYFHCLYGNLLDQVKKTTFISH